VAPPPPDFHAWRVFLVDVATLTVTPLPVVTKGRSTSFGNPFAAFLPSPRDGSPALVVTYFLFGEGAAPGEAGSLLFFSAAPDGDASFELL
jgi:hypothetical protein